jgi:DNA-binding transcriptional LysR family regulator
MPRLTAFRARQPDIEIWLDTSGRLVDFDRQEVEFVLGRLRSAGGDRIEERRVDDDPGPFHWHFPCGLRATTRSARSRRSFAAKPGSKPST